MYYDGKGIQQDHKQAAYWFTLGAKQGDADAQSFLGKMYYMGEGVPQNNKFAYVWSSLAASAGHENARYNRDFIAQKLTPQILAEAQELAAKLHYKITHPTDQQN